MHTIPLPGCSPTPLAAYLKALGLFRILSQQLHDSTPRAHWQGNAFVLTSTLDRDSLRDFLLNHYAPSPLVAPWNGGSGFMDGDDEPIISAIAKSGAERFESYRVTIKTAYEAMRSLGLTSIAKEIRSAQDDRKSAKKSKDSTAEKTHDERVKVAKAAFQEAKASLFLRCRNTFSEFAVEWLDAACVLTGEGAKYPPLLGTGGNDGNFDFTSNFMQRLVELFDLADPAAPATPEATALLDNALFAKPARGLSDKPIGQFSPAVGGGANASTGFDAKSTLNPWDFVLTLEGALLFAAATVKRLEGTEPGQLVYPFCVQSSGSGYGSSAITDESDARCEIWMPLWQSPLGLSELQTLLAEGRAWVGRRPAKNGVDFARAVASLGVDRGIGELQRYGFHVRNGLAYFATPLQRLRVRRDHVTTDLLAACDGWIQRFLPKANSANTPGSIARAARRLEAAILAQCASAQSDHRPTAQELLAALGDCERALASSAKWTTENYLKPVPPLSSEWIEAAATDDPEYRLAASLASLGLWVNKQFFPIRRNLEPVKVVPGDSAWADWDDTAADVVSSDRDATALLCAIMRRRLLLAPKASTDGNWPEYARLTAWPADIAAFIEGQSTDGCFDDARFIRLLRALSLVAFRDGDRTPNLPRPPFGDNPNAVLLPAFYGQLKLCFAQNLPGGRTVPVTPSIFHLAASGNGARASEQALRRLHASSVPVAHVHIALSGRAAERTAAALLFPLWHSDSGYSQLREACEPVARHLFSQSAYV
jgi:CRISPR-associated protein Csx17